MFDDPGKILVVEDHPTTRLKLSLGLQKQGHTVAEAENGKQALEKLLTDPFDLVLLDIVMPEMDGYQVLEEMKRDVKLRDVPVIVISANDELENIVHGIEMGADDYLPKSCDPILLKARIGACLEKKRLRDQQRKILHTFATQEIAEELMANGFNLGGKRMDATILFADIRSFTTYAEQNDAQEVLETLNEYFATMFEPIVSHDGIVNQILGDGLMALFGTIKRTGDHHEQAVLTAIEMMKALKTLHRKRTAEGKFEINIGIGIASGRVMVGYAGTQHRATYTCVGDAVNLAARIESHTREVNHPILIDSYTREYLPASIPVNSLGRIIPKGKTMPVKIYSVLAGS
ncbi:MAG TPA: response regulator [Anaerolineales bacterium]|nr:response regulator [Anaerolineales bacterium]